LIADIGGVALTLFRYPNFMPRSLLCCPHDVLRSTRTLWTSKLLHSFKPSLSGVRLAKSFLVRGTISGSVRIVSGRLPSSIEFYRILSNSIEFYRILSNSIASYGSATTIVIVSETSGARINGNVPLAD